MNIGAGVYYTYNTPSSTTLVVVSWYLIGIYPQEYPQEYAQGVSRGVGVLHSSAIHLKYF